MNIICKLFGHRPEFGYGRVEGAAYFKVEIGAIDGIGREHAYLRCGCERCGISYRVGRIHLPETEECRNMRESGWLIDELRGEPGSGDSVTITCANDDPDTKDKQEQVIVCGEWTGWKEQSFCGETVRKALKLAAKAREAAIAAVTIDR